MGTIFSDYLVSSHLFLNTTQRTAKIELQCCQRNRQRTLRFAGETAAAAIRPTINYVTTLTLTQLSQTNTI